MENDPFWLTDEGFFYRSGYVAARLDRPGLGLKLSAVEAGKVVKVIKDFTFIFGYKPRELSIMISKARRRTMGLLIG